MWYILDDDKNPIESTSERYREWAEDFENKRVGYDEVGGLRVSTVFLGLDHSHTDHGHPLLFETMVFPMENSGDIHCERGFTWSEAEEMHKRAIEMVLSGEIKYERD